MRDSKPRRKRSKLVTLLLLPAIAAIWLVGWSLYWIGTRREEKPKRIQTRPRSDDGITLVPSVAVEQETLEASA